MINGNRIFKGYWWLPSSADTQVAGSLIIEPSGKVKLELFGGFDNEETNNMFESREDSIIFGRCYTTDSKMTDISLIRCHSAVTLNFSSSFPLTRYTCDYALIGIHIETMKDAYFFKAHVDYPELTYWCPPTNISTSFSNDVISLSIDISEKRADGKAAISLEDDTIIKLKEGASYKPEYPKLYIDQSTYLEILKDEMSAIEVLTIARGYEQFLSVATLTSVEHGKIILYSNKKCQEIKKGEKYYHPIELVTWLYKQEKTSPKNPHDYLFYYEDIAQEYPNMFKQLYTDTRIAQILSNFIDSLEKKRVFTSNDFLVVIQAIDGFAIRFKKEKKLLPELQELRKEFKDIKKLDLTDYDLVTANGSRNYYSHILKLEKKDDKHALEGWELYNLTKKLRVLLIVCILSFMGLNTDRINQLMNKCNNSLLR